MKYPSRSTTDASMAGSGQTTNYILERYDADGWKVSTHNFSCGDDEEAVEVGKEFLPPNGQVKIWHEGVLVATVTE